jgi:hypothetical protein
MAFFSPLASGSETIPIRAPVKSDRRSSPEVTRSALDGHSERGIINFGFVSEAN